MKACYRRARTWICFGSLTILFHAPHSNVRDGTGTQHLMMSIMVEIEKCNAMAVFYVIVPRERGSLHLNT